MVEKQVALETRRDTAVKLDSLGWALFFVWVGLALLLDVGWGIGLLGVGLITLGVQVARKSFALRVEAPWTLFGLLLVVGGAWELFEIEVSLLPVLLIAVGVVVAVGALSGRYLPRHSHR